MILEVKNASFKYPGSYGRGDVLKNVSFSVESGDVLAVLGPNGAGKTTLLRCIMDFVHFKEGSCTLDGTDIRKISPKRLWSRISYVPQAKTAVPSYTVEDMTALGLSSSIGVFSSPKKEEREKVNAVLKRLGIDELAKKRCSEISGGELQLVLIARAIVSDPELIILDEPESNLDFKNQLVVLSTITELAESGMACIFNTHYPVHAIRRANKALMLSRSGEFVFGSTREVVTEEAIEAFFGVKAVLGSVETRENIYTDIIAVEGLSDGSGAKRAADTSVRAIAVVTVIFKDRNDSDRINLLLHRYNDYIICRAGLPYREGGVFIINITLDAPIYIAEQLTDSIRLIDGVSVKATYAEKTAGSA